MAYISGDNNTSLEIENITLDGADNDELKILGIDANQTFTLDVTSDNLDEGVDNLYFTDQRFDTRLATKTTDHLQEGTLNHYFTDERFDDRFGLKSTSNLSEGSNKYWTQTRFDDALAAKSTNDLPEGLNLYYTDARFDARLSAKTTDDISEGVNKYYSYLLFNADFAAKDSDDLTEGSNNLYHTDTRVRNAIGSTDPKLLYDVSTGNFSLDLPSIGDTFYTADGSLTEDRTIDLDGNGLNLTGGHFVVQGGISSMTNSEGIRLSHTFLNNNTSSELFFIENELENSGAKLRFDGSANKLYLSTLQDGTELQALAVTRTTGDCAFGYNVEAAGTLGSMTAGRGVRLSHDYNGDDTSSELFFIENDDERFGARLKYDAPTNHLRLSMMNWGTEYEIMNVSRTSQATTFENLVRIKGSLNLDYINDTAPQLELRDSDQVRTASFRMPGPADPVGNDTLLIQNNRGQADIVFTTENGGDFRFCQDYSTDSGLDNHSFYIGHANVASSATITEPFIQVGNSSGNITQTSIKLVQEGNDFELTSNGAACYLYGASKYWLSVGNQAILGNDTSVTNIRGSEVNIVDGPLDTGNYLPQAQFGQLQIRKTITVLTGPSNAFKLPSAYRSHGGSLFVADSTDHYLEYVGSNEGTVRLTANLAITPQSTPDGADYIAQIRKNGAVIYFGKAHLLDDGPADHTVNINFNVFDWATPGDKYELWTYISWDGSTGFSLSTYYDGELIIGPAT